MLFPSLNLSNSNSNSNTLVLIIVFVLGMFFITLVSRHSLSLAPAPPSGGPFPSPSLFEDPINLFEHTHFDGGRVPHYDSADFLDLRPYPPSSGIVERFEDNGRDFPSKPWYSCNMKSNCLPGENDTGEFCVKQGCPAGMRRGSGLGSEFCYPECPPGYEQDNSRCFKVCPDGYITKSKSCIRPTHEFKKDIVPARPKNSCMPLQSAVTPIIPGPPPVVVPNAGPVIMNASPMMNKEPVTEYFDNKTRSRLDPSQINSVALMEHMANAESENKSTQTQSTPKCEGCPTPKGKLVWNVQDRVVVDELPCPMGYSQSGDLCMENCPPNYRDTGDNCVLDSYSVDRPNFSIGEGVPYSTKRSKYQNINPVSQCN